ncbi:hypothetical protein DAMNIGENAA_16670 [Desulforhabdus amnigena]|jgi:hypothetical protein|uniref:Uncharacterized protein n=1 Tax=Desulforhabdus amnigena TaxID=40218 RepID=A0A9W6FSN7_9BACT|nr:hypothetical protein DAMNIGENAA_16670 [Desulforhabdus amnigena]
MNSVDPDQDIEKNSLHESISHHHIKDGVMKNRLIDPQIAQLFADQEESSFLGLGGI